MKHLRGCSPLFTRRVLVLLLALAGLMFVSTSAFATPLPGTVFTPPGSSVLPGLIPPGTPAGALLASMLEPWTFTTTAGTTSGSLTSAVFMNPSGTLDFYYQVANNSTSATAIARESNTSFAGFGTWTGFRTDGASFAPFVSGTVPPVLADRTVMGGGSTVGFNFNPPEAAKIQPGQTSNVLVISTDATAFTIGNAEVIDGGTATVKAFQPIPEPISMLLLGSGLLGLGVFRRVRG